MNVALVLAGSLGILGATIHGVAGELLVMRRLSPATLPPSRFGGPGATGTMIHATWHMTTIAFLTLGFALLLAGSVLNDDAAPAVGVLAAVAFTGFAALAAGLGVANSRSPRSLLRHPGPAVLAATAVLAWWGSL